MIPKFRIVWTTFCPEQHPECYHYSLFKITNNNGKKIVRKISQANNVKKHEYWKLPFALWKGRRKNVGCW
jgi:hypothetical protein